MDFYPKTRPFTSLSEMHRIMIQRFNSIVPEDADTVYHLGDFALVHHTKNNLNDAKAILKRLNGTRHILIKGNHDRFAQDLGFHEVHERLLIETGGKQVLLCHYRQKETKIPVLHGHDHTGGIIQGKNINLNCELNELFPYTEFQVLSLIEKVAS